MQKENRYPHLFSPIQIGPLRFKNRLGFAPMVCNKCEQDGTVTDAMEEFIYRQAKTGVSYVTIGDTEVDDSTGAAFLATLNIDRSFSMPGLVRLAEAAKAGGAFLSVELNHSGRGAKDALITGDHGMAPSAIPIPNGCQNLRAMTREEMEDIKRKFAKCANRVQRAGFSMVLVHCAHNNLLGQFLSPLSNQRTDEYGGSPENRMRYPLEVLEAVRAAVGPKMGIEIRVSADEECGENCIHFEESLAFMKKAQKYVDLIHISRGNVYDDVGGGWTLPTYLKPHMFNVEYAARAKAELDVPVAVVGNITSLAEAEEIISSGKADIVCMARMHLADMEAIQKFTDGRDDDVRPCLRCHRGCIDNSGRGRAIHCTVNPGLGHEELVRAIGPSTCSKKVLVAGGGPAGMVAAQTLTQRGHQVILCERGDRLGGLLIDAAAAPFKTYMQSYLAWLIRTTERCGAEIRLNTPVTRELVAKEDPDAVIVATGSRYFMPPISGIDGKNVHALAQVEHHLVETGRKVIVCGGGVAGMECALGLAMAGKSVTVVDMIPAKKFAGDIPYFPSHDLVRACDEHGVTRMGGVAIRSFGEHSAELEDRETGSVSTLEADSFVLALGVRPNTELTEELRAVYPTGVYTVGDCGGGHNLYDASHTAYFTALSI